MARLRERSRDKTSDKLTGSNEGGTSLIRTVRGRRGVRCYLQDIVECDQGWGKSERER